MEQKRDWALQLKRAILESYNAVIPYHARELVMQLGQDKAAGETRQRIAACESSHMELNDHLDDCQFSTHVWRGHLLRTAADTSLRSSPGDQVRRNSSSKRQHSAPEYLERRRAYKRATSFNQKLRLRSRDRKSSLDGRKDSLVEEEDDRERKTSTASCPDDRKVCERWKVGGVG